MFPSPRTKCIPPENLAEGPKSQHNTGLAPLTLELQFLHLQISLKNRVALTNLSEVIHTPEVLSTDREKWLLVNSPLLLYLSDDAQTFQQTISLSALDKVASCKTQFHKDNL